MCIYITCLAGHGYFFGRFWDGLIGDAAASAAAAAPFLSFGAGGCGCCGAAAAAAAAASVTLAPIAIAAAGNAGGTKSFAVVFAVAIWFFIVSICASSRAYPSTYATSDVSNCKQHA